MAEIFIIGMGGFVGAVARYTVSSWVQAWSRSVQFPYGTLAVNILGCFSIGLLSVFVEQYDFLSKDMRSFILIGFLGAFTTFSTFSNDTVNLFRNGEGMLSVGNIGANLLLGLTSVWLGRVLAGFIWK